MHAAIPMIEGTDHADALCVRRPNREAHAPHTVDRAEFRAELVINAEFVSLAEEINVDLAEGREKGIGVTGLPGETAVIADCQVVGVNRLRLFSRAFENAEVVDTLQLETWFVLFVRRNDFDLFRAGLN